MHHRLHPSHCGCPDFSQARLSRRRLLGTTAAGAGALVGAQLVGDAFSQVAYGGAPGGNVVVVLSLRGGSDGLSIVVPRGADHDRLAVYRPNIVVPESTLLGADPRFGLHPALGDLMPMWNAGTFGAVHAVGLPAPNRSHFEAMEEIEDADPGLDRAGGLDQPDHRPRPCGRSAGRRLAGLDPAADVDDRTRSGARRLPGRRPLRWPTSARRSRARRSSAGHACGRGTSRCWAPASGWPSGRRPRSRPSSRTRGNAVHDSAYPEGPLAEVLANTAALIRADVGTRMVAVDYGDWDMHEGVGSGRRGLDVTTTSATSRAPSRRSSPTSDHAASRVTVVTISEFGRRVEENGDGGVDHGYGNAMLLLGAGVSRRRGARCLAGAG